MEEAPENGKESPHSAHANGMNEIRHYFGDRISFCLQAKIIRLTRLDPVGLEVESNFA
jgi:hypothetical protein